MHFDPLQAGQLVVDVALVALSATALIRLPRRQPAPTATPEPAAANAANATNVAQPVDRHRVRLSSVDYPQGVRTEHLVCIEHDNCPTIAVLERDPSKDTL